MADQFIGEIRMFTFPFAPRSWAFCDGALMVSRQNQALYTLLGNAYGGAAPNTFQLPDLRGKVPMGGTTVGTSSGLASVLPFNSQIPSHAHTLNAANVAGTTGLPSNKMLAQAKIYAATADTVIKPTSVDTVGANAAHENMQPYLAVNFCIALSGVFPSRS